MRLRPSSGLAESRCTIPTLGDIMAKKKASKKKARKKNVDPVPMSKGFGHLTIKKNWIVSGGSWVDGGEPDWEGWQDRGLDKRKIK